MVWASIVAVTFGRYLRERFWTKKRTLQGGFLSDESRSILAQTGYVFVKQRFRLGYTVHRPCCLSYGWIDPRVSGKLCRGGKTADVSDLAEDVRAKGRADAGDGGDRRVQGVHDLGDLAIHFPDLLF